MRISHLLGVGLVFAISLAAAGESAQVDAELKRDRQPTISDPTVRGPGAAQLVNWEDPHVHPLDMTPDGQWLLAVNTPDNRLEVFSIASGVPVWVRSIPVGVDPVSVRARSNSEAWVVNHISDSVSIVDLTTANVVRTLDTLDEPCDVVFAGGVGPAATRAFVSCSHANTVQVFSLADLSASPTSLPITGEDPRALAVSPDGSRVLVAVFESGNRSTVLGGGSAVSSTIGFPPNVVSDPSGPWAGVNPPPNSGGAFVPPINAANPPRVSLIVKKDALDRWMDDNGGDWTTLVSGPAQPPSLVNKSGRVPGWDLYDHDLAYIDASTLDVYYASGLMNICMAMGVNPATGRVLVVGTDGINEKRFEPNVNGTFVRIRGALVTDRASPVDVPTIDWSIDLNPHLEGMNYASSTIPQTQRDLSIGDPRAIVWRGDGDQAFIAGMGSNNVVVIDASGARDASSGPALIEVGQGPTGLALDEPRTRLYVLNRFDATISTVDSSSRQVVATTAFFDPTPPAIKLGRPHLYDTHRTSGLGQAACASCHVDSRFDRLAWDLGDPAGVNVAVNSTTRNLGMNVPGLNTGFLPYHPMKGPMTTQTMQDIIGKEPLHWRGDRLGLEEFNGAFVGLQGDDQVLTVSQMQQFEDFLATIQFPPNPYRNLDNSLPTNLPLPGHFTTGRFAAAGLPLPAGNAVAGLAAYRAQGAAALDDGGTVSLACVTCHTLPTGAGSDYRLSGFTLVPFPVGPNGERHLALVSQDGLTNVSMKIPQTRNMQEKTGFNTTQQFNTAGFGLLHDGSVDSIERFVSEPAFNVTSDQMIANLTALMLAFSGSELPQGSTNPANLEPPGPPSKDTHAAVGTQTTVASAASADSAIINAVLVLANAGKVGVIAKGRIAGTPRGWKYSGAGSFQSDIASQVHTTAQLLALAAPGSEITLTVVVAGTQHRAGIDRDLDGWFDADEASVCADPADAVDHPGSPLSLDVNGDLTIGVPDIFAFLTAWFAGGADFDGDGVTGVPDIFAYLSAWFAGC